MIADQISKKKSFRIYACSDGQCHIAIVLEMVNKCNLYVSKMRDLKPSLNKLLKKGNPDRLPETFEEIKKIPMSELALTHFDSLLDIIVTTDNASQYGIGVSLLYKGKARKKGSHSCVKNIVISGKKYSQIEKLTLAIKKIII